MKRKRVIIPDEMDSRLMEAHKEMLIMKVNEQLENCKLTTVQKIESVKEVLKNLEKEFLGDMNLNFDFEDIDETKAFLDMEVEL